ncbi:MAG: PIN domain-containing protein [Acidobacteria bacterium]|nr:PIN domain-containing protein [Acidobacteriota bacterium]
MATYLLDTSVIIDCLNGKRGRPELLEGLLEQGNMLACCSIIVTEVYAGLRPHEAAKTDAFLRRLDYREVT